MRYPKPKHTKVRKTKYTPLFPLGYCWGCREKYGQYNYRSLERHHIYEGNPDRSHSEQYGLYVDMCNDCHRDMTDERDRQLKLRLKQEGQRRFVAVHGKREWMKVFGRDYL